MAVEPPVDGPAESARAGFDAAAVPAASASELNCDRAGSECDHGVGEEQSRADWIRLRAALKGVRSQSERLSPVTMRAEMNDAARRLAPDFAAVLPHGTSVVVDLTTFEFVHAATRSAALKAFVARFGSDARGWAFEIGVPMNAGGGVCAS